LIVDDEVGIRESLKFILKKDYEILVAKMRREAFLQVKESCSGPHPAGRYLARCGRAQGAGEDQANESDAIVIWITATNDQGRGGIVTRPTITSPSPSMWMNSVSSSAGPFRPGPWKRRSSIERKWIKLTGSGDLIGKSKPMKEIFNLIRQVADSVHHLVMESGTGKELVSAPFITAATERISFITINCAAIPETLIESELFGRERSLYPRHRKKAWPL
jgi:DNA-binding NtrC family response regulator